MKLLYSFKTLFRLISGGTYFGRNFASAEGINYDGKSIILGQFPAVFIENHPDRRNFKSVKPKNGSNIVEWVKRSNL